jgi:arginine exporter protein ArgO
MTPLRKTRTRRPRQRDLPPNLTRSLPLVLSCAVFVSVLAFALALLWLKAGTLTAVATFVGAVVVTATGAVAITRTRSSSSKTSKAVEAGTTTPADGSKLALPPRQPPEAMGPVVATAYAGLCRVAVLTALAATFLFAMYGTDVPAPKQTTDDIPSGDDTDGS